MFRVKWKSSMNKLIILKKTIINFGGEKKNLQALENDPKGRTREESKFEKLTTTCEVCKFVAFFLKASPKSQVTESCSLLA